MPRRAMPAADWLLVRKDASKSTTTSDAVADSGKAPPAHVEPRTFPGDRAKVPKIDDTADTSEVITLPRKSCTCADVTKCACEASKADTVPVQKPLPTPAAGQSDDSFVASCMADPKMLSEYPDEKQRAAVCYAQVKKGQTVPAVEDEEHPGMMLALAIPTHIAKSIAQADGIDPDDMHVTLGYYGRVGKDVDHKHVETVTKCVAMSAKGYKPTKGHIGGVGRFNASGTSDGNDVLIAHVDSPGLHDIRDHLIEHVQKCAAIAGAADEPTPAPGPSPKRDHGYTPHITLKYIAQDADMPVHKLPRHEFTFTHIMMSVGKNRQFFPLGDGQITKSLMMPIVKAQNDKRLATGIVLEPETVDIQGDIYSADVIEKAAHDFLAKYNKATQLGLQHEVMKPEGVELVESWIAPVDYVLNGREIKQGTWMMTVRVLNDELWERVKSGSLGGFSIGGAARVQRLT